MINGQEYAWENIDIVMAGKLLTGVTGISYTERKEHSLIYGRGAKPVAIGTGKIEYEGSITLLQSEVEALQKQLPRGKGLTQIDSFNISVAYAPSLGETVIDTLKSCRINEVTKAFTNEDGNMVVELPLTIGDILYNSSGAIT